MPTRKSSSAERVGFSPTPWMESREPGTSSAATMKNAAEERSEGTISSRPVSLGRPVSVILPRSTCTSAPNSRRAISVWSRERTGSVTEVAPSANSPANSTHVFTWALATGQRVVDGPQRAPWISSGGNCSSRARDARAHFGQRLHDAPHGPARERFIAADARAKRLRGEDAGEHADGGAGVAGVQIARRVRASRRGPCPRSRTRFPRLRSRFPARARTPAWNGNPRRWSNCGCASRPSAMAAIMA